jgi:hypothetical protein
LKAAHHGDDQDAANGESHAQADYVGKPPIRDRKGRATDVIHVAVMKPSSRPG